jgi:GNAT superfamily N-acetyltransferase
VLPEHQRAGVGTWLVAAAHGVARKAGYVAGVHCLMWSGSHSNQITRHSGRTFRRYALYEKAF